VTLAACNFVKYGFYDHKIGLFSIDYGNGCQSYDAEDNGHVKSGRAFGVLQNLLLDFSLICLLLLILFLEGRITKYIWLATKISYCLALFCTFMVFIFLGAFEDGTTDLGAAGVMNILNVLVILGMVSLCWFVPVPEAPMFRCCGGSGRNTSPQKQGQTTMAESSSQPQGHAPGMTITKTVKETPDGRLTIEEVTHPDGSKTITRKLEQDVIEKTMEEGSIDC
jgi:hypothetical protein